MDPQSESGTLKRKRQPPGNWWAVAPSPIAANPPDARKDSSSRTDHSGRGFQVAHTIANRDDNPDGNSAKIYDKNDGFENERMARHQTKGILASSRNESKNLDVGARQDPDSRLDAAQPVKRQHATSSKESRGRTTARTSDTPFEIRQSAPEIRNSSTEVQLEDMKNVATDTKVSTRSRSSNTNADLLTPYSYVKPTQVNCRRSINADREADATNRESVAMEVGGPFTRKSRSKNVHRNEETIPAKQARPSEGDNGVQFASSKLSKNHKSMKNSVRPVLAANTRDTKGLSALQATSQSIKRKPPSSEYSGDQSLMGPRGSRKESLRTVHNEESKTRKSIERPNSQPIAVKRRRLENAQQVEYVASRGQKTPSYQHLAAVTRRVPRNTIDAKWDSLQPVCIERIAQLFQDVQRPVLARLNNKQRRTQATTVLHFISRKLLSKISKGLPFPKAIRTNREDDFDFEKILDNNRTVEYQLTSALHANELLEAELRKETAFLESEKNELVELETNAKVESSKRKQEDRNIHALLQSWSTSINKEDLRDDTGFSVDKPPDPLGVAIQRDNSLRALVHDLQNHVDSMEGNLAQLRGIKLAMCNSKAAVQATLYDHLSSTQYEEVVLE